ncbi:MAG: helix-turn-helix transcriptional regulator [Planctomycetaceae bacterium]|nr:helix-turn-helix transcriptional regulator [Planctomycetaceae bacterium]
MQTLTRSQLKRMAENIRSCRDKQFPERGGNNRLAKAIGVSPQTLSQWINGSRMPPIEKLQALVTVFGISIQALCGLPEAAKPPRRLTKVQQGRLAAIDTMIFLLTRQRDALLGKKDGGDMRKVFTAIKEMVEKVII